MNILIVANIPPYAKGGAENQAKMLAGEFVKLGHKVTIAGNEIPAKTDPQAYSFSTIRIRTIDVNRLSRAVSYFLSLSWYILRKHKHFDVVYCRFLGEAALSIALLKQLFFLKMPLVACTACAGKTGDAEFLRLMPATSTLVRLINRQCNTINNISPKIGEELEALGVSPALFKYLPNGVDTRQSVPKKTASLPRKVVYLGRLAQQKAIPVLLEAVGLLFDKGLQFELHLIGDGPDKEKLETQVERLKQAQSVFFHGHVDNHLLPDVLPQYDIFVLPSLYEGFATATIEAMLAGLPAVVTRSGGPDYFVDETVGRLCVPGDSDALSISLAQILNLDDEALLEMGERARQRVIERFDIRKLANAYIALFESLMP